MQYPFAFYEAQTLIVWPGERGDIVSEICRRDLLASGVIVGGALASAGIVAGDGSGKTAWAQEEKWDASADVLILGGGIGGVMAAYVAAKGGAKVILVESGGELGGSLLISGGNLHVGSLGAATPENTLDEICTMSPSVNQEFALDYVKRWNEFRKSWIYETGAPNVGEIYDVMITVGATYEQKKEFFDYFYNQIIEAGGEVFFETRGVRLCVDDLGGVCGAIGARRDGSTVRIGAHAVILATGGFSANDEMRKRYFGAYGDNMVGRVVPFNQGDGHRMALELGAQLTRSMGQFYGHLVPYPSLVPGDADEYDAASKDDLYVILGTMQNIMPTGILVNIDGKRFVDENTSKHIMTNPFDCHAAELIGNQPQGYGYAIFDSQSEGIASSIETLDGLGAVTDMADTIEGLADALAARGVRRSALLRTIEEYNSVAPEDLEVAHSGREAGNALPLEQGPFFAVQVTGGASATFGGIKIDPQARVLGCGYVPIRGLYATAMCAGGFSYDEYVGSLALGAVYGIVAAETALAELSE